MKFRDGLLSIASGMLLILIFPTYDVEALSWFALIPFLWALTGKTPLQGLWLGWIMGLCYFFGTIHWVTNTMINYGNLRPAASLTLLVTLSLYLSSYIALFGYLTIRLSRGNDYVRWLLVPLLWTTLEFARTRMPDLGFPWSALGYSQYRNLTVAQLAAVTGFYGISFLIALTNSTIFYLMRICTGRKETGTWLQAVRVVAFTAATLVITIAYGRMALSTYDPAKTHTADLKVALLQGNVPQEIKWDPAYKEEMFQLYSGLTKGVTSQSDDKPDLVVWPEAAVPFFFQSDEVYRPKMLELAERSGAHILLGSPAYRVHEGVAYPFNSAFLISPRGEELGRYDKIHLVPFGEYVPFSKIFFFVEKMVAGVGDYRSGDEMTIFSLPKGDFGVLICFEIIFPGLSRAMVKNGAQFLTTITNDAWFGRSAAPYQHFSMAVFRAIENRVPVIRAANTGISGIIDPMGRIVQASPIFETASVTGDIQIKTFGVTFYTQYGDLFAYLVIGLTLLIGLYSQVGKMFRSR